MKKILLPLISICLIMYTDLQAEKSLNNPSEQFYLYVGAYSQGAEEGIYVYKFDASEGDLTYISIAKGIVNPSYLAIDPKKNILISVNETGEYQGEKSGSVSSFSVDPNNGSLHKLNEVASGGGAPCYVSIDHTGSHAYVANYSGGNFVMLPIQPHGKLMDFTDLKQQNGSSAMKGRQDKPHAHGIVLDPKQNFALATDLGTDQVVSYAIDRKNGKLIESSVFNLDPGSGPRHLTFHPNKKLAFVISELNSTISSFGYDAKTGRLTLLSTVPTLPEDFSGKNTCADIHVSPDGQFLYGSNRGHDSIVIYQIDRKTGGLTYVDHTSVKGKTPRNFVIDPTGKFLLVANQNTNNIVVFKVDQETGKLKTNGVEVQVNKPVCLKMIPVM